MKVLCKNEKVALNDGLMAFVSRKQGTGTVGIVGRKDDNVFIGVCNDNKNVGVLITRDALITALRDAGIISGSEGMTTEEERDYAAAMESKP